MYFIKSRTYTSFCLLKINPMNSKSNLSNHAIYTISRQLYYFIQELMFFYIQTAKIFKSPSTKNAISDNSLKLLQMYRFCYRTINNKRIFLSNTFKPKKYQEIMVKWLHPGFLVIFFFFCQQKFILSDTYAKSNI